MSYGQPKDNWREQELAKTNEQPPDSSQMKTIIQLSAEETAAWLSGERPVDWMEHQVDPQERKRYYEFKARMRTATIAAAEIFGAHLVVDSEQTAQRLTELTKAALDGDPKSGELLIVMLNEFMRTGLGLGAR